MVSSLRSRRRHLKLLAVFGQDVKDVQLFIQVTVFVFEQVGLSQRYRYSSQDVAVVGEGSGCARVSESVGCTYVDGVCICIMLYRCVLVCIMCSCVIVCHPFPLQSA